MKETLQTVPQTKVLKPIGNLEIFGYGFGGLANNISSMVVSAYVIFFLTDVAGLPAAAAGAI